MRAPMLKMADIDGEATGNCVMRAAVMVEAPDSLNSGASIGAAQRTDQ